MLIICINHGEPLQLSSTNAYLGKRQVITDSNNEELKSYEKGRGKGEKGKRETITPIKKGSLSDEENILFDLGEAIELVIFMSKTEVEIADEERCLHETHASIVIGGEQASGVDKEAIERSSEGSGTKPEVRDEPKRKSKGSSEGAENEIAKTEKADDETADEEEGNLDDDVHTEEDKQTDDEAHDDVEKLDDRPCNDQDPTARSDQGKKKRRKGKDSDPSKDKVQTSSSSKSKTLSKPSSTDKFVNTKEPLPEDEMDVEEPILDDAVNEADQPQNDAAPTQEQPWFNDLVYAEKDPLIFDELMATPIDFSKFAMDHLKLDKITKDDLVGHIYKLLKGTYKSSIELEYNMDQCYNTLTDQLDWTNPKGDRCLYYLSNPLPLQGSPGHLTIPVDFFFNNDLEDLRTGNLERKYTVSITKTKAARYELKFIKDMIPRLWSPFKVAYDKDVALEISHSGPKQINVRRPDQKLYTFKEGDFQKLHLNDIEDMLLLHVQNKLFNLDGDDIVDLEVSLRMFTRRIVIQKRVEDVQLGVESY
ncbi:hypothetical protein Tco_1025980 [Tanacetum coccineum]